MGWFNKVSKTDNDKYCAVKSFTYFLPSPPARKHGYQEKEFDQVLSQLLGKGYDLIDIKMQSMSSQIQGGVWMCCILGVVDKKLANEEVQIDYGTVTTQEQERDAMAFEIEHEV